MDDGTFDVPELAFLRGMSHGDEVARLQRWELVQETFFDLLDTAVYAYAGAVTVYLHFVA